MKAFAAETGNKISIAVAAGFFALVTWTSFTRWANFDYRTFDLAYYVQAIWQLIHGRVEVSVEHVPLLGNHVEPIVFLFAPLFLIFRHPMLFVALQNLALAAMGPIGYRMARRAGFRPFQAFLLSTALLLAPATGYVALHEFHPEALTAPFLLLLLDARAARTLGRHWIWFIAVLACKENMALLLAAYCAVNLVVERSRPSRDLRRWYLWPLLFAILWFVLCSKVITPAFNSGRIDYLTLYDRLGHSGIDIVRNALTRPQIIGGALLHSLGQGNLLWAILLPFLGLPLLRPRWLIISLPILLQHLLSWRSSEWFIYFHYAAPLVPLFWMAVVEAIAPTAPAAESTQGRSFLASWSRFLRARYVPALVLLACLAAQWWLGPAGAICSESGCYFSERSERARKDAFIGNVPANASVVAGLPYLSHLAMREKLYSLHYILKGLQTLSHATYEPPPPTDYVLIDYNDTATFDASAGYYHPAMQTKDDGVVPSSDQLLHNFLKSTRWESSSTDELTLLHQNPQATSDTIMTGNGSPAAPEDILAAARGVQLRQIKNDGHVISASDKISIRIIWTFSGERDLFPWLVLRMKRAADGKTFQITRGLCTPETSDPLVYEKWEVDKAAGLPPGTYSAEAVFLDNTKREWIEKTGQGNSLSALIFQPVSLGEITVR